MHFVDAEANLVLSCISFFSHLLLYVLLWPCLHTHHDHACPRTRQQTLGDEELKRTIRIPTHAIDIREFTDLMNRYNNDKNKDPEEPYRRAFASINKDGSGHVSAQELRVAMKNFLGPNALSEVMGRALPKDSGWRS